MEELVAEFSAAFLCADLQIHAEPREYHAEPREYHAEPREYHAAYIQGWLRVLRKDRNAIVTAASQASKAR